MSTGFFSRVDEFFNGKRPEAAKSAKRRCSWCRKREDQVAILICAHGGPAICDACIGRCVKTIEKRRAQGARATV